MRIDRRTVMTGVAGLTAAGLGSGRARAAGPLAQGWTETPLEGFTGLLPPLQDGSAATFIDAPCFLFGSADLVFTAGASDYSRAAFGVAPLDVGDLLANSPGYALRSLALHGEGKVMALLSKGGPPAPESWAISQRPEQYQALIASMGRSGLEPIWVSVDNLDGAPRFTTVWRKSSTAWEARHGVKSGDLTALTKAMQAKGLRPARFAPYLDAGQLRFAVLYRPAGKHGWQAWVGDESPEQRDKEFRAQGFALLAATSYEEAGKRRWACIWQKAVDAPQDYIWGN